MAVKEKKAMEDVGAAEAAKKEDTLGQEKAGNAAETMAGKEEVVKLAYIGPTLPAGQLKCNKIFIGTETEIKKELQAVLEKYPLVEKMLVPASRMGEKKDKAKTAGNILHKYYADIVSSIAGNSVKEG